MVLSRNIEDDGCASTSSASSRNFSSPPQTSDTISINTSTSDEFTSPSPTASYASTSPTQNNYYLSPSFRENHSSAQAHRILIQSGEYQASKLPKKVALSSEDEKRYVARFQFRDVNLDFKPENMETQKSSETKTSFTPRRFYPKSASISFFGSKQSPKEGTTYKPDLRVRVRTIGLIGALLPGIGCYICILYSYLFQFENVSNFTSTTCEDLHSPFPPVSFSIGVWKPQKYFWLVILTIHFPPRLLFGYVYKSQYRLGESEYRSRNWFPKMILLQVRVMFIEALGLIVLSIFDMETYFVIHAVAFGIWLTAFNFNMLFNCILHYHSGIRDLTITHKNIFYIKCTIFLIAYPFSWSTAFTYFSYATFCSAVAFALFAIAEYVLIGCNCLFYFLLVWELTGSRLEFFVTHKNCTTRTELDVI